VWSHSRCHSFEMARRPEVCVLATVCRYAGRRVYRKKHKESVWCLSVCLYVRSHDRCATVPPEVTSSSVPTRPANVSALLSDILVRFVSALNGVVSFVFVPAVNIYNHVQRVIAYSHSLVVPSARNSMVVLSERRYGSAYPVSCFCVCVCVCVYVWHWCIVAIG